MLLAHLRLSVSDPPTTASLPHPVTVSLANPQGGSSVLGRHTGRTVDGYVLAVNGVFNCDVKFSSQECTEPVQDTSKFRFIIM